MCKTGKGIISLDDIVGKEYGYLTVKEYLYKEEFPKKNIYYYKCICKCGNERIVKRHALQKIEVKSCGCLRRESALNRFKDLMSNLEYPSQTRHLYNHNKSTAKLRKLSFNLNLDNYRKLILSNCHYCNSLPSNTYTSKGSFISMNYNGIDRKDSSIGYEETNIVTCCKICNRAKMDMSYENFLIYIKRIGDFHGK